VVIFYGGMVYGGDYVDMNISITRCSNSMDLVSFIRNMDGIVNTNSGAFEILSEKI
jgi:peroxiredoxin family protein